MIFIKFFWTIVYIVGYVIMVEGRDRTPTDCNYSFSFHISDLNMNEWIPMKGRMEVVPNNSVFMGS